MLVIIGLLVAGVMLGQELIRQSQYREHIVGMDKIRLAVKTFRLKFDGYPGDLRNATSFGLGTHNGDGNGYADGPGQEGRMFWEHLAAAGLIEGSYSGNWTANAVVGVDVPRSGLKSNLGWWNYHYSTSGYGGYYGHIPIGNYILVGSSGGYYPSYSDSFNGSELQQIDLKVDDGLPLTGRVLTWNHGLCTNGASVNLYNLTVKEQYCWFWTSID